MERRASATYTGRGARTGTPAPATGAAGSA